MKRFIASRLSCLVSNGSCAKALIHASMWGDIQMLTVQRGKVLIGYIQMLTVQRGKVLSDVPKTETHNYA
jgi:hypothetical protein